MLDSVYAHPVPALKLLGSLWFHLPQKRKLQFILLTLLMVVSALAEVFSLGAIIPFLAVLADPERVLQYPLVSYLAQWLNVTQSQQLTLPLALIFASAAVVSAAIRALQLWANTRLSYAIGGDFSVGCYQKTLYQPYETHLSRNSSQVLSTIARKVGVATAVLYQLTTLLGSLVVMSALVIALLLLDFNITLIAGASLIAAYLAIVFILKRTLIGNSLRSAKQEDKAMQILQEGLGGIRDVLLEGSQLSYSNKYAGIIYTLRRAQATNVAWAGIPRYLMEAVGMCVIAALACSFVLSEGRAEIASFFPALGAFALGAQRLLPTLQQVYGAWASIVGNYGAVVDVIEMLDQQVPSVEAQKRDALHTISLCPKQSFSLNRVRYRYAPDSPWIFDGLNLKVAKGSRVGIMGSTGTGKTTLLDLLMSLLKPSEGNLCVDETVINESNARAWQNCIAHVPQSIFLTDASIAENIAFGVEKKHIDMDRVHRSARQAQIADFITARPEGYHALVGERGVSLSGGQLQRIGIARALYKQAPILILDEATSALDRQTEAAVMDTIYQLDRSLTLIIVAHRVAALKGCNRIIKLTNGKISSYSSYEDLVRVKDENITH